MNQWQSGLAPHLSWQAPGVGVLRSLLTMLFSLSSQVPISKSSQPDGPAAVVVVAGAGVVVVVSGLGPGGQGQLERSGELGPLVHPVQISGSPHWLRI